MPLIALAVACHAAGLLFGFAHTHGATGIAALALLALAVQRRSAAWFALTALLVAGDVVATERRWVDAHCIARIAAPAAPIRVALITDAAPGSFARAETREGRCAVRVSFSVADGAARAGAVVAVRGDVFASGDGLLVKNARISTVRSPGALDRLRARASRALQRDFGPDAALAKALLIAETADLGPEVRDRFAAAGLVHILSISGLHVTIVASAVVLLLSAARLSKRAALIGGCALTAFYVALIGAPPPAVRSAVMFAAMVASRLLQRPTSAWSALALGAALPVVGDPRVALDVGWQLTIAGMVALIAAGDVNRRFLSKRLTGWRLKLASEVLTGVIATLVTAPIVAWYFGRTSLVAPLANIAANPVANVLQPTLFLALALGWCPAVSGWVADAARPGLRALDGIASGAASLPGANFHSAPTLATTLLACLAIGAVIAAARARRPLRMIGVCVAALAVAVWLPLAPSSSGAVELHAIDVGQGDGLGVRTPHGSWILIDAGRAWIGGDAGRRTIVPYVRRLGGDVALFVQTHPHEDHVGGAASVLEALRPASYWESALVAPNRSYLSALGVADRRGITWHRVHPGDTARIDGVLLRVLAPDSAWVAGGHGTNETSTVVMVEYGAVRMLLMGDAQAGEEEWIESEWPRDSLRADVLKVGHHGSQSSSTPAFLDAVRPRVAVISVGAGNSYGHPHRRTLDALAERHVLVLRTDQLGSIVVATDGHRIRVAGGDGTWMVPP